VTSAPSIWTPSRSFSIPGARPMRGALAHFMGHLRKGSSGHLLKTSGGHLSKCTPPREDCDHCNVDGVPNTSPGFVEFALSGLQFQSGCQTYLGVRRAELVSGSLDGVYRLPLISTVPALGQSSRCMYGGSFDVSSHFTAYSYSAAACTGTATQLKFYNILIWYWTQISPGGRWSQVFSSVSGSASLTFGVEPFDVYRSRPEGSCAFGDPDCYTPQTSGGCFDTYTQANHTDDDLPNGEWIVHGTGTGTWYGI
jgi:hypothetical protein